jgi:hypothetical protein
MLLSSDDLYTMLSSRRDDPEELPDISLMCGKLLKILEAGRNDSLSIDSWEVLYEDIGQLTYCLFRLQVSKSLTCG